MGSKAENTRLAYRLMERDGGWVCHYCGCNLIPPGTPDDCEPYYVLKIRDSVWVPSHRLEEFLSGKLRVWTRDWEQNPEYHRYQIDHMHPKSKGGRDGIDNRVLACFSCNQEKSNKYSYTAYVALWQQRKAVQE